MHGNPSVPLPLLREPLPAAIEYVGRQWSARLRNRGPHEGVVESRLLTSVGSIVLLRLASGDGGPEWLTLECAIRNVMAPPSQTDGYSTYLVRWRWAWCPDGVDAVAERVSQLTGVRSHDLRPGNFRSLDAGGIYAFEPDALRYAERTLERAFVPLLHGLRTVAAPDPGNGGSRRAARSDRETFQTTLRLHRPFARLRAQERVRVDLPCRYVVRGEELSAWLRDLSRAGLFVTTRWTFPEVGQRVAVSFVTTVEGHRQRFVLTGVTRRVNDDWSAAPPPGFGVEVDSVVDGDRGERFQRYLNLLLRRSDAPGAEAAPDAASTAADGDRADAS